MGVGRLSSPGGTVQAKITTAALAKDLKFWAHMGNPDGDDFPGSALSLPRTRNFKWESPYLHDMKAYPWTTVWGEVISRGPLTHPSSSRT
jgi:hypothetical protein